MKRTGLRTEIIVNLIFLMGAAVLFLGFLLLKMMEKELVSQRIVSVSNHLELLSRSLSLQRFNDSPPNEPVQNTVNGFSAIFPRVSFRIVDSNLNALGENFPDPSPEEEDTDLKRVKTGREPAVRLRYSSFDLPFVRPEKDWVLVTVPVLQRGEFAGALQARFSLEDVRQRTAAARKIVFLYAGLYGLILVLFGGYLLGRTVVHPIGRLRSLTRRIASGDYEEKVPEEGPREIAELSESFNLMTSALRESRRETRETILSLQRANEDLQRTRDELIRAEKLASVGQLAAGMAHEIGNPLGALMGYLDLLRAELPKGREKEMTDCSLAEAARIDRLVRDLLDYSAPAGSEREEMDPASALRQAVEILRNQGALDERTIEDLIPGTLPTVIGIRHRLHQVFVNLLLNARDATSEGGTLRLEGGQDEKTVWITIADDGQGIPPQALSRIFDPFFTTKPVGKGRGLGLSVCHRIVEDLGGRIEVGSEPGEGSTFSVYFPRAEI